MTSRFSTRNFGTETVMRVNDTPMKRAFVQFEVAEPGIRRAVLRLFAQTAASTGFQVYATSASWTEAGITHGNAPAPGALVATVAPFTETNSWREIDVTSAVTGPGPVSFLLTTPTAAGELVLTSKEGGLAPELVLEVGDPPVPLSPPTITGTPRVGETLTVGPGTSTGTEPIAYAYQWLRCGPVGGGCADVAGATGATYLLGAADLDRTIRVRETGANEAGSASATSDATARVAPALEPPVPLAAPAVTGTAHLGQTLTAGPGSWTGTPPLAFTLQWQRCDANGGACTDVEGATGTTYDLGATDLDRTIRVRETATNEVGSMSATSAAAGPVVDPGDPPAPLSLPTIAGTQRVGETLTASPATWTGTEPIAFSFQWQRCGPAGGGCADVEGANGPSYLLGVGDFDRTIRVRETGSNLAGSASATSDATAKIAQAIELPVALAPPAVTGTAHLGRTLTAVSGTWTGTPPLASAYQWERCDASGCADVEGATSASYLLGADDLDWTIRVRETAVNEAGSASATSPAAGPVIDPGDPPAPLSLPTITGTRRVGQTLTAVPAAWTGTEPIAYAYQWQRCGLAGGGCVDVEGATGASYLLGADDVERTIRVRETGSNLAGSASATSEATETVSDIPVPPPPPPPSSACSRDDATGCAALAGARVSLLNQKFTCNRPLGDIAAQNPIGAGPGHLPLLVEIDFTTYVDLNPAAVDLRQDCAGDGDDETIDLILAVEGDGRTFGGTADAIKVRLTASQIQVTGYANCGPRGVGANGLPEDGAGDDAHQDGAQIQGGDTIEFIDFEFGDWESGTATCQGAAGTFVPGTVNNNPVLDMACIRCKSVSCNGGFLLSFSDGSKVIDSKWRTGNPADRVGLLANGQTGLCRFGSPPCLAFPAEATNFVVLGNYCDPWPYEDELP